MKTISGKFFFEMKATHGVPWDVALQQIRFKGYTITWDEFIDAARSNKWWDFQTLDAITFVLQDVIHDKEEVQEILSRMKLYILQNPHPDL